MSFKHKCRTIKKNFEGVGVVWLLGVVKIEHVEEASNKFKTSLNAQKLNEKRTYLGLKSLDSSVFTSHLSLFLFHFDLRSRRNQ